MMKMPMNLAMVLSCIGKRYIGVEFIKNRNQNIEREKVKARKEIIDQNLEVT